MVKFDALFAVIDKFEAQEITEEEMDAFLSGNIKIKSYIPVSEKKAILDDVFDYVGKQHFDDIVLQALMTEAYFKTELFFAYSNIEKPKIIDEALYNKLMSSGLMEFVLNLVGFDYLEFKDSYTRLFSQLSFIATHDILTPPVLAQMQDLVKVMKDTFDNNQGIKTLTKLVSPGRENNASKKNKNV